MRIIANTFWQAKAGNSDDEYEDAAWPSRAISGRFTTFRTAVADGATEASFSGLWARLLVKAYKCGYFDKYPLPEGLVIFQQIWKRSICNKPLPWYAEQKLAYGAFAYLIGLTLHNGKFESGNWNGIAVGDSCLFQVRDEFLLVSFPLFKSEQFNSSPILLSSIPESNKKLAHSIAVTSGSWQAGDTFYLMSDALACWFLRQLELPEANPLEFLQFINTNDEFARFVQLQRNDIHNGLPMLKNDDVTLVRCSVVES